MFSIYEKNSDWLLAVIKFKNAYFLCEYVTDMQLKNEQNMTPENRSFCYYGHKFEEYVTKSKINIIEILFSCVLLLIVRSYNNGNNKSFKTIYRSFSIDYRFTSFIIWCRNGLCSRKIIIDK